MTFEYHLSDIVDFLGADVDKSLDVVITGLASLDNAIGGDISFIANPRHAKSLSKCKASAVIMPRGYEKDFSGICVYSSHPYLSYAKLSKWFDTAIISPSGVHPSAVIANDAAIGANTSLGPNVVIESGVSIADGSQIGANTFIGTRSTIGKDCRIKSNVSIYHDITIGDSVTIHSGAVIGSDGFGFAPNGKGGWEKIHQLGGVLIGNKVEIGACSTVDRGAIDDTVIGDGVILDNHVMIAHNVKVGENTAMAAFAGIAGSAKIGKNCFFAGDAACLGHLEVADNVQITARSYVTKPIKKAGSYSNGGLPLMESKKWRRNAVIFGKLEKLAKSMTGKILDKEY